MKRRDFLKASAVGAAVAMIPLGTAPAAPRDTHVLDFIEDEFIRVGYRRLWKCSEGSRCYSKQTTNRNLTWTVIPFGKPGCYSFCFEASIPGQNKRYQLGSLFYLGMQDMLNHLRQDIGVVLRASGLFTSFITHTLQVNKYHDGSLYFIWMSDSKPLTRLEFHKWRTREELTRGWIVNAAGKRTEIGLDKGRAMLEAWARLMFGEKSC